MMPGIRNAPPRAAALVESLRGLGYTLSTALADLIDNSIAASARNVAIDFHWEGKDSSISLLDDGCGMDASALERAMTLGDSNPLDTRDTNDLGRFGLGLKTASFSQARVLTLASKPAGGSVECLRWDLDFLADPQNNGWFMLEGPIPGSEERLEPLEVAASGTLVLLQRLDRLVTEDYQADDFLSAIDRVEAHLAMTFHRYLEGPYPRLTIIINGQRVSPWDPFMTGHPSKAWATMPTPIGGDVTAQCHVLPHKDKLSPAEYERFGGLDGWTSSQGFYLYRNERLLVAGGWLGLGAGRRWTRDEAHRLARIRVDFTNASDAEWKIDIRKSTARPPVAIRRRLQKLAEVTRERARRVYAHRGVPRTSLRGDEPLEMTWQVSHLKDGIRYRISRDHEAIAGLKSDHPELADRIEAMLRCIEETVPVQRIWLDTTEQKKAQPTGFAGQPASEVATILKQMFRALVLRQGHSVEQAKARLSRTEPFDQHPELIAALAADFD